MVKKYRCPIDSNSSNNMKVVYNGKQSIRHKDFPNEKLLCKICGKVYRWKDLKEMEICNVRKTY